MKRLIILIAGILMLTGTAMAHCGACEGDAEKAKGKAAAEMKKMKCGPDCTKPCCTAKKEMKAAAKCGEDCKKPCCAGKEMKDKASDQAQQKRKKWWKFWGGDEAAE